MVRMSWNSKYSHHFFLERTCENENTTSVKKTEKSSPQDMNFIFTVFNVFKTEGIFWFCTWFKPNWPKLFLPQPYTTPAQAFTYANRARLLRKANKDAIEQKVKNLPVLEIAKLWYPPQAINPIGTPIKDFTTFGSQTILSLTDAGPKPSWP